MNKNYRWVFSLLMLMTVFTACEQEDKYVGSAIVGDNAAQFNIAKVDVTATTLPSDTVKTNREILFNAVLGVFDDAVFGKSKASYYTQVRLSKLSPEFGKNPIVDSVILSIPTFYNKKDTLKHENYLFKKTYKLKVSDDKSCKITDTVYHYRNDRKYKIDSIYGKKDSQITLKVERVTESMKITDSIKYSNMNLATSETFGEKKIDNKAWLRQEITYLKKDKKGDSTVVSDDKKPVIRIKLDNLKTFLQNKVFNEAASSNLSDQISFINNILQGIKISAVEDNGFLLNFNPSEMKLTAYYTTDNDKFVDKNNNGVHDDEENCPVQQTLKRVNKTFDFIVGNTTQTPKTSLADYNVAFSSFEHSGGSIDYTNSQTNYVAGLGANKIKIEIDKSQMEAIKDSIINNNWVVTDAHFKVYPDKNVQSNLPIPVYLYTYNYTESKLLPDFGVEDNGSGFSGFPANTINVAYDKEKGYYLLRVTKFIKDVLEENASLDDLAIEMGSYLLLKSGKPKDAFYSNRAFNPFRLAIMGSGSFDNDKKLRLEIYYNKKQ